MLEERRTPNVIVLLLSNSLASCFGGLSSVMSTSRIPASCSEGPGKAFDGEKLGGGDHGLGCVGWEVGD